MTASLAERGSGFQPLHRILTMTGLFWASSYVLLTLRGALFNDDWSRLVAANRLLAVTVGASAFALVLRRLQDKRRISLMTVITWIAAATLLIMVVRLVIDQLKFDVPLPVEMHLLWSLSWSGYFGLWVMGAIAFDQAPIAAVRETTPATKPVVVRYSDALSRSEALPSGAVDDIAQLIEAIAQQAADFDPRDRDALADRVLRLGGYEVAGDDGWARAQTARARFAAGVAARLGRS